MVKADFAGRRLSEVDAGFEPHWLELPDRVVRTGKAERMELFAEPLGQWFDVGVTKIDDERAAILFKDVTERKRSESERELMLAELNHRVKNMLAVVQSIANQTADSTEDPKEFAGVFGKRVRALAGAHDVLTQEHWTGAHLKQLVGTSLTTFAPDGSDRIDAEGPDVRLSPNAAVSLSMALHELGTNALKYGALSTDRGRIRIRWTFEEGASRLLIEWNEQDGPGVMPPKRWGFGTRLLEKGIAYELAGKVDLDYASSGLVCRMAFPAERVIAHDGR